MKYRLLWHLLRNYIVEHTLISLVGTCHCIRPCRFARPICQHHWFCKFRVVGQKPEFILAGNFVYVGLFLIPRKKTESHNTKHNLPRRRYWLRRDNATESSCVLCCDILVFFHMFLHIIPMVLHLTHIGWWGIAPTDTLLVPDASEMLHISSSGDGVGVQTLTSRMGAWYGWFIDTFQNCCFPLCQVQFFTGKY
jgi:hypothetical protein